MSSPHFTPIAREITAYQTSSADALKDTLLFGANKLAIVPISEFKNVPNFFDDSGNLDVVSLQDFSTNYRKYIVDYNQITRVQVIRANTNYHLQQKHPICIEYNDNGQVRAVAFYVYEKGYDSFMATLLAKVDGQRIEHVSYFTIPNIAGRDRIVNYDLVIGLVTIGAFVLVFQSLPKFSDSEDRMPWILTLVEHGILFIFLFIAIAYLVLRYVTNKLFKAGLFSIREREIGTNYLVNRIARTSEIKNATTTLLKQIDQSGQRPLSNKYAGIALQIIGTFFMLVIYFDSCSSVFKTQLDTDAFDVWDSLLLAAGPILAYIGYHLRIDVAPASVNNQSDRGNALFLRSFTDDGLHTFNRDAISSSLLGLDLPVPIKYLFSLNWLKWKNKPDWFHLEWVWLYHPITYLRLLTTNRMFTSEEQLVSYLKRRLDNVIGIGKPGDELLTPGAAKLLVADDRWQEEVKTMISSPNTRLVIIQPNISEWGAFAINLEEEGPGISSYREKAVTKSIEYELEMAFLHREPYEILLSFVHVRHDPQNYETFKTWFETEFIQKLKLDEKGIKGLPAKMPDEHFICFEPSGKSYVLKSFYTLPFTWPITGCSFDFTRTLAPYWERISTKPQPSRFSWNTVLIASIVWFFAIFWGVSFSGKLFRDFLTNSDMIAASETASPDRISGSLDVPTTESSTDLLINEGDQISLTASGQIRLGTFAGFSGPNGIDGFDSYSLDSNFKHGSLIGQIGEGPWFLIGDQRTWTAQSSGRLKLRVNDADDQNNTGGYQVSYTIQR